MNKKLLLVVLIIVVLISMFTVFTTVVNAQSLDLFFIKKQNMIVTLKNESDIDVAKNEILKIPQIKIIKIKYRDKEWSKMVNKMDLPKMENPFKNEFTLKINKKANINEIYNKIKQMTFVEDVVYISDTKSAESKK